MSDKAEGESKVSAVRVASARVRFSADGRELEACEGDTVASALLAAAVAYAKRRGVHLLEGYPVDKAERSSPDSMWFGSKAMFDAAGFEEVARRKPTRPVVRIRPAS